MILKSKIYVFLLVNLLSQQVFSQNNDAKNYPLYFASEFNDTVTVKKLLEKANHFIHINEDSTLFYIKKAKNIAIGNAFLKVLVLSSEGLFYQKISNYTESIRVYHNAAKIANSNNLTSKTGSIYNGLGINYFYLQELEKAKFYLKKASQSKGRQKQYKEQAIIQANLSNIYLMQNQIDSARIILLSLEDKLKKYNAYEALGSLYSSLGGVYQIGYQKNDSALYYYKKSLEISKLYNIEDVRMTGEYNVGQAYLLLNRLTEVKKHFDKALELSQKLKNKSSEQKIYESYAEYYAKINDFEKALNYKQKELNLYQSIFQAQKQKDINELEIKYKSAQREKQLQKQKAINIQEKKEKNFVIYTSIISGLILIFIFLFLLQRRRANKKLMKQKNQIFTNIVHDIRTPLTLISGPLQKIKEKSSDLSDQEDLETIEHNSIRLQNLVTELLDVSKIERGKFVVEYQVGNPLITIDQVVSSFKNAFKTRDILFVTENETAAQKVYKYPAKIIEKTVSNLLHNALNHVENGGKISLQTTLTEDNISIKVSDNGEGISQKNIGKIFERYYTSRTTQSMKGTGLGLSMLKQFVNQVQGTINVQSELGKGSTFNVNIPVNSIHQEDTLTIDKTEEAPYLLIIEDDYELAQFTQSIFDENYHVELARNGTEALEKINTNLPDIILSDLMLPDMNGSEILNYTKQNELTNHIPFIVFSALHAADQKLDILEKGADAYLTKPFDIGELKLTVKNLLQILKTHQEKYQQKSKKINLPLEERLLTKNKFINDLINIILSNIDQTDFSTQTLVRNSAISRTQLHRKIKVHTGFSTANFITHVRLEKSKDLLLDPSLNVKEITYQCGFNSQSYFTNCFKKAYHQTPLEYRASLNI